MVVTVAVVVVAWAPVADADAGESVKIIAMKTKKFIPLSEVMLPVEGLEELGDNLFVLRGGLFSTATGDEDSGCGCGCSCDSGKDCGCGCGCKSSGNHCECKIA
jgi:hypothetical protein